MTHALALGQAPGLPDPLEFAVRRAADQIATEIVAFMKRQRTPEDFSAKVAKAIAEGAEPSVSRIVSKDVLPPILLWGGLAVAGGLALAGLVGSLVATARGARR